jgi:glycerol-3-phosphate dehydrogenase (NAD+)
LVSSADINFCCKSADILVFVVPHQFVKSVLKTINVPLKGIGVSLIKGFLYENDEVVLISDYISKELNINMSVLMGANIADEVGKGCVSEGTLGYCCERSARVLMELFNCYSYRVSMVEDIPGVELCGSLKNIVSIGYGIGCGLGYSTNTTVALMRNGLREMVKFCKMFYPSVNVETFFESSGIADLVVSCISGRNYKCGYQMSKDKKSVEEVEGLMRGQKIQGSHTSKEIYSFLKARRLESEFPIFVTVYKICYEQELCDAILECIPFQAKDK